MIIRNDDVAYDTDLDHLRAFNEICDRHGCKVIQAVTPMGRVLPIQSWMSNDEIKALGAGFYLAAHSDLLVYLRSREDWIGIHGLWHTHIPTEGEIELAKKFLGGWGLYPSFFVPPFNEGTWGKEFCGLRVVAKVQRLEDYLHQGIPTDPIVYLHSWRFDGSYYQLEWLDRCLGRIMGTTS